MRDALLDEVAQHVGSAAPGPRRGWGEALEEREASRGAAEAAAVGELLADLLEGDRVVRALHDEFELDEEPQRVDSELTPTADQD